MKEFVNNRKVRDNGIKLAHKMHMEGFIPDIIYVSLRGGACLGNVISEYFKLVRKNERPVFYAAVVAHSYTGVHSRKGIRIDGWTYDPKNLRTGDKVLIVDDIFDSGHTINHLVKIIHSAGVPDENIKIAVHDYKVRQFEENQLSTQPDYYCRKLEPKSVEEDSWIHYLSHDLVDLSNEEIDEHYSQDSEVNNILKGLNT